MADDRKDKEKARRREARVRSGPGAGWADYSFNPDTIDLSQDEMPGVEPLDTLPQTGEDDPKDAVLKQFRDRMGAGWSYWAPNFRLAEEDVTFTYEQQWDADVLAQRGDRPSLTINQLPDFINSLVGVARQSKFSIQVKGRGGVSDRAPMFSGPKMAMAYPEVMSGIIRDIEQRCKAPMSYARALQHALEGGFGWLRANIIRDDLDLESMEIVIEHIQDRWSVIFDPRACQPDLQDARWASVTVKMTKDEFDERYPNAKMSGSGDWLDRYGQSFTDWWGGEGEVRLTDYYWKQAQEKRVLKFIHPQTREEVWGFESDLAEFEDELAEMGFKLKYDRKLMVDCVMMIRCTAYEILEGPFYQPGNRIPIVPVFGRQIDKADRRTYLSLVRYAHDAQRMYNKWISAATERVSNAPKEPWVMTADQIAGYEEDWRDMHLNNPNAMVYNHMPEQPPPYRQQGATMPTAEVQMVMLGKEAVQDTTGLHEATRGLKSNETSGKAIQQRQMAGELRWYEFIDNLAHSISIMGDILCQMIPKVYAGDRLRNIVLPDDTQAQVHLGHRLTDRESGKEFTIGALKLARYHCMAQAGPLMMSEKERLNDLLLEWGKNNPQLFASTADIVFETMDAPGSKRIAERLKRSMNPAILSEQEREGLPPPQPTPEQQVEAQKHQAESVKAESVMVKAESDKEIAALKLEEARIDAMRVGVEAELVLNQKQDQILGDSDSEGEDEKGEQDERMKKVARQEAAKWRIQGSKT